uniref:Apoptosis inhibitor n=1 Tax=Parastrongyloides trichosuri TaxID=131310 RepID=A0A0N4ZS83_PARTI
MTPHSFDKLNEFESFKNCEVTKMILLHNRLKTFVNWPFDKIKESKCNSLELAKTGFIMKNNDDYSPSAQCICCLKELIWKNDDIPHDKHFENMPSCVLINILSKKKEVELTVYDVMHILTMREISNYISKQFSNDKKMRNDVLQYNDDFILKTMKKL